MVPEAARHGYAGGKALTSARDPASERSAELAAQPLSNLHQQAGDLHMRHGAQLGASAGKLGVAESALAAVVLAERQYLPRPVAALGDKMPVRFEPYEFFTRTGHWLIATHKDQAAEYQSFADAKNRDDTAAHLALRMGICQVSGTEAEAAGFATPQTMHDTLQTGEAAQISAFAALVAGHDPLRGALAEADWTAVAQLRAGPGYAALGYDHALAAAATAYGAVSGNFGGGDDDDQPKKRKKT